MFDWSCAACSKSPAIKDFRACGKNTRAFRPVYEIESDYGNEIIRFWNCPLHFIPDSVLNFLKCYDYHKNFPAAPMPDFDSVNPRFVEAVSFFERKVNEFKIEVMNRT